MMDTVMAFGTGGRAMAATRPRRQTYEAEDDSQLFVSRPTAKELGRMGEDWAVEYLLRHGYELIARNWTCVAGEADVIVRDEDGVTVLVEVKTRYSRPELAAVMPELAVDEDKLKRYRGIAQVYYSMHSNIDAVRFDIVAINLSGPALGHLYHIPNAYRWDRC